jgi:hypothetical protein
MLGCRVKGIMVQGQIGTVKGTFRFLGGHRWQVDFCGGIVPTEPI